MRYSVVLWLIFVVFALLPSTEVSAQELDAQLAFEQEGDPLADWHHYPSNEVSFDEEVFLTKPGAITLTVGDAHPFTASSLNIPIDFEGEELVWRGMLKTESVEDFAGLWMRQDGADGPVQFDNMQDQRVGGDTDWTEYEVRLPLDDEAESVTFGVLVSQSGRVWADNLALSVDGKDYSEVVAGNEAKAVPYLDSGLDLSALSKQDIENLAILGRVWGYLKYHHPAVVQGEKDWDQALLNVMARVLEHDDAQHAQGVMVDWVESLGVPDACDPCVAALGDTHLTPDIEWIGDRELLGNELSVLLTSIHENRPPYDRQRYIRKAPGVGNAVLNGEATYPEQDLSDDGVRLLGLFRYWNIIEYWFPYRNLIEDDWSAVLQAFIPSVAAASDRESYLKALQRFTVHIGDGHANVQEARSLQPPVGDCYWPFHVRFIESEPTIVALSEEVEDLDVDLAVGDQIRMVDGQPIQAWINERLPYYSGSNLDSRHFQLARNMPRGVCEAGELTVNRQGEAIELELPRIVEETPSWPSHDLQGETFQVLDGNIGYIKLSDIAVADVDDYMARAKEKDGLVIDIRNYPSEFVVFALGQHLVTDATPFARFTTGKLDHPGAFAWTRPIELHPEEPHFDGPLAILVDEASVSQSEYTAMAFQAAADAKVVGSTTAGADGNISFIPLPGDITAIMTGIGVFYPDKAPTQQIGIQADIPARPTVEGLRDGRDQVLEAALEAIRSE